MFRRSIAAVPPARTLRETALRMERPVFIGFSARSALDFPGISQPVTHDRRCNELTESPGSQWQTGFSLAGALSLRKSERSLNSPRSLASGVPHLTRTPRRAITRSPARNRITYHPTLTSLSPDPRKFHVRL